MPSTHTSLHYHLVFGTRNREPNLTPEWREKFHDYLGGTVRGLGAHPEGIGGVADHVHLLVSQGHALPFGFYARAQESLVIVDENGDRAVKLPMAGRLCRLHRERLRV